MFQILFILVVILCSLTCLLVFYLISLYNQFVSLQNQIKKAWSNIDVLLKQRHDELIKLVDVCKQYMQYEQTLLTQITEIRTQMEKARMVGNVESLGTQETALRGLIGNLFAVAENYPDLKANAVFTNLQVRISGLESDISDRREFYNDSVNLNNIMINQFPGVLVAKYFGFDSAKLLEFNKEELSNPSIGSLFKPI